MGSWLTRLKTADFRLLTDYGLVKFRFFSEIARIAGGNRRFFCVCETMSSAMLAPAGQQKTRYPWKEAGLMDNGGSCRTV